MDGRSCRYNPRARAGNPQQARDGRGPRPLRRRDRRQPVARRAGRASVLVTDKAPADEAGRSVKQLDGLPIEFRLGEHREEDFTAADLVVTSPAIPPTSPYLQRRARRRRAGHHRDPAVRRALPAPRSSASPGPRENRPPPRCSARCSHAVHHLGRREHRRVAAGRPAEDRARRPRRARAVELHARVPRRDAVVAARRGRHDGLAATTSSGTARARRTSTRSGTSSASSGRTTSPC